MSSSRRKEKDTNQRPIVMIKVNVDEMGMKTEEEIQSISDRLNKNLRIARARREDDLVKSIEKEICYVQRETKIRQKRRQIHEKNSNKRR